MLGQNSSVYKNKARIRMFGRIRLLFQSLQNWGQNSIVWKNHIRITMLIEIGICMDKIRIRMCTKIGPEFQRFQG